MKPWGTGRYWLETMRDRQAWGFKPYACLPPWLQAPCLPVPHGFKPIPACPPWLHALYLNVLVASSPTPACLQCLQTLCLPVPRLFQNMQILYQNRITMAYFGKTYLSPMVSSPMLACHAFNAHLHISHAFMAYFNE